MHRGRADHAGPCGRDLVGDAMRDSCQLRCRKVARREVNDLRCLCQSGRSRLLGERSARGRRGHGGGDGEPGSDGARPRDSGRQRVRPSCHLSQIPTPWSVTGVHCPTANVVPPPTRVIGTHGSGSAFLTARSRSRTLRFGLIDQRRPSTYGEQEAGELGGFL